jgi:Uncharacterized protein conserved in bacteria (DUF2188)
MRRHYRVFGSIVVQSSCMASKTVHVYPSKGAWVVKKNQKATTVGTKRQAVSAAVRQTKKSHSGQLVIHARDGRIVELRTYGMPTVPNPPKPGALGSKKIAKAVGKVVRDRLQAQSVPPRVSKSEK